jgi:hypothetical protein
MKKHLLIYLLILLCLFWIAIVIGYVIFISILPFKLVPYFGNSPIAYVVLIFFIYPCFYFIKPITDKICAWTEAFHKRFTPDFMTRKEGWEGWE